MSRGRVPSAIQIQLVARLDSEYVKFFFKKKEENN